jgi:predicted RNase H-like HicB family nuclease
MLTAYIRAAMDHAHYEILEGDEGFYGEIPAFQGVWANEDTLEACREELQSALEDWILFRVAQRLPLPIVDGIEVTVIVPNPHRGDIGRNLLSRILRQAGISRDEWEQL